MSAQRGRGADPDLDRVIGPRPDPNASQGNVKSDLDCSQELIAWDQLDNQRALLVCTHSSKPDPRQYLMTGEGRLIKAGTRKRVRAQPKAPKAGALLPRPNPPNTAFRRLYERGDLPLRVDHHTSGNQTKWEVISCTSTSRCTEQCDSHVLRMHRQPDIPAQRRFCHDASVGATLWMTICRWTLTRWTSTTTCPSFLTASGRSRSRTAFWPSR